MRLMINAPINTRLYAFYCIICY